MATMKASELKAKLQRDLTDKQTAAEALQAERVKLALPAHSGDQAAMLRLQDIRADFDKVNGEIGDLVQAIADVQPAVETEQAKARLDLRERTYAAFEAVAADVVQRAAAVDAAISELVEAYAAAHEPIVRLRELAVELLVPMASGVDVSRAVSKRFETTVMLNIPPLRARLDAALERKLSGRRSFDLEDVFKDTIKSVDVRLQDALKTDRRMAARAGVDLETEAA